MIFSVFSFIPTYDLTTPIYTARGGEFDWQLGQKLTSISLEWLAMGGCWSGELSIPVRPTEILSWINNGLGLHIEVWNRVGQIVWDGYVDTMTFSLGNIDIQFGPLSDVGNQVGVTYAPLLDATLSPPLYGVETETILATNDLSQSRYGVWERWFQAEPGECSKDHAEANRDRYLKEIAFPKPSHAIDLLTSNNTVLKLGLLGYCHRLKSYVYESAVTATTTASVKLAAVLDADPNGIFSSSNASIETNAFLVTAEENKNRIAEAIVNEIVSIGADATDDRFTFGVYPGRYVKYAQIPDRNAPIYQRAIYALSVSAERYGLGYEIDPWDIQPAQWLYQPDVELGKMPTNGGENDIRYMFIESVKFSDPYGVSVNGEPQSTLAQMQAKAQMEL